MRDIQLHLLFAGLSFFVLSCQPVQQQKAIDRFAQSDIFSLCAKDGQNVTSQPEMTVKFNDLFTTVGSSLAADLPSSDIDPLNYLYLKRLRTRLFISIHRKYLMTSLQR